MRDVKIMIIFSVLTLILDMVCAAIIFVTRKAPEKYKLYWIMMGINMILTMISVIYFGYCLWPYI